jgi:hypothetical protein
VDFVKEARVVDLLKQYHEKVEIPLFSFFSEKSGQPVVTAGTLPDSTTENGRKKTLSPRTAFEAKLSWTRRGDITGCSE